MDTNPRELRGKLIASMKNAVKRINKQKYMVSSQNGNGRYYDVQLNDENEWQCNCADFIYRHERDRNRVTACKHIFAVAFSKKLREQIEKELVVIEPVNITTCIFCQSSYLKKFGIRDNKSGAIQRFICGDCNKTLNVHNNNKHRFKLRRTVSALDCIPSIHFTIVGQRVPLRWRMNRNEPNECATINLPDTTRNEYVKLLGFYYAKEKLADSCGVSDITLNPDDTQQIYFLFTFPESEFAYIICQVEATWYDSEVLYSTVNGAFLFLRIPGTYKFVIRFDWRDHTDINGKLYSVKISEWNKISIQKS